ncbi:MAG: cysteine desulfurase NifS [Actinomycetota bacterium]|nr:cysteine desulfurase NifS [Actinomycetota bacterium]
MNEIYFDHSATTPVLPEVVEAMTAYFTDYYGNPSSLYQTGQRSRQAVEAARQSVADLLGADDPKEIIFTGSGTEADNLAIKGVAAAKAKRGNHIVTLAIEHPAVIEPLRHLEKQGFKVTYVPVDKSGIADPAEVVAAITDKTILVSVMLANNVIGTIQPVGEISRQTKARGIALHTDAVQAVGNIAVKVNELGADLLAVSAHKFHGPKGIGALYVRKGTRLDSIIHGGGQERGKRSGTENVPGIIGFAKAMQIAEAERQVKAARLISLRERLVKGVLDNVDEAIYLGDPVRRLPGNACFSFKHIEGESLVLHLDMMGIAASSGSACASHSLEPSHVILAMGYSAVAAHGSLRITMGRATTEAEVDKLIDVLPGIVARLREMSPFSAEATAETFMAEFGGEEHAHDH